MIKKDFTFWHKEKTDVQANKTRPFFHEREIWFCTMGVNIGYEQDGRGEKFLRPILVLKKFNNEVLWAVPLTTKNKQGIHYYTFSFNVENQSTAILSQVRLIDAKRLHYKVGNINTSNFNDLKTKIRQLLA